MLHAGARVKLCCPQCKSQTFELSETIEEVFHFEVVEGVMPADASDRSAGAILHLSAQCRKCGHRWKPRAKALDQVIDNQGDNDATH